MLISLDCESTGLDIAHGARPFIVTCCREDGQQLLWEWDVDPVTRQVTVPPDDAAAVRAEVERATRVVGQNIKFDARMLRAAGVIADWPWEKTDDTLVAGHLLASGMPHDLTNMVLHYTGEDIKPWEDALRECVLKARNIAGSKKFALQLAGAAVPSCDLFADDKEAAATQHWHLAKNSDPTIPSAGSDAWHCDYWLPRTLARYLGYPEPDAGCDHRWGDDFVCRVCGGYRLHVACREYANADSSHTLLLWNRMRREVEVKGLGRIYADQMRLPRVITAMEDGGVTYDAAEGARLRDEFKRESDEAAARCVAIAGSMGYDLELPKGATNKSLSRFVFGCDRVTCEICGEVYHGDGNKTYSCTSKRCQSSRVRVEKLRNLDLPPVTFGDKTGAPSLNKEAFDTWELTLDGDQLDFVTSLQTKRKRDTFVTYSDSYARFGVPLAWAPGFIVLSPNLNQTGTAHLRMSSNNPNGQNVGKQTRTCKPCGGTGEVGSEQCRECRGEGEVSFNLRRAFRPAPGREFWAIDYENIELMIPAYEAGEELMVKLFDSPGEPPFYGSQHLLNASIVYPELFWPVAEQRGEFKRRYASTYYQWIKNFDFALAYQCGEATGDRSARRKGAWRAVKSTFKQLDKLSSSYIAFARKHGYVETLPDKTVDLTRGYPIMCQRGSWGDVSPTIPFNYHVSGSACWAMRKAMVRCHDYLDELNAADPRGHRMSLQIHDEILFDFPAGGRRNLPKARRLRELMEESGKDIGIPLRAAVSWHPHDWAKSEECR